jgi:NitT/TauT family transport system substrate-binding protein
MAIDRMRRPAAAARLADVSRLSHRHCLRAALLVLSALLQASCKPAPPPFTLSIATYVWPGSFWIDVAWTKGWFAAAGLNVKRMDAHGGYFEALDAVVAGRIDVMGFSEFDLVRRVADGHDLVGIAAVDDSEGAEALVAHSGIHTLRELKGRRLALPRGTYLEYIFDIVAEREHIDTTSITLVDRSVDEALADFVAGRVDAAFLWEPRVTRALAAGGESLFSTAQYPGLTYSVLAARRDLIASHPEQMAALLSVWHRASRYVLDHPDETAAIVAQLHGESIATIRELSRRIRVLDLADNDRAFSYAAGFESLHASWRRMNDFMLDRGMVHQRVDSAAHLDTGFIRRLE